MRIVALTGIPVDTMRLNLLFRLYTEVFIVHDTRPADAVSSHFNPSDIFQHLLDSFPDMIHSVDDAGRIVYANRTAEALLGYNRDELIGMDVHAIYADQIQKAMERGFADLRREGDKRVESLLKTKSGESIPVEIRSFGIYDDEGNFLKTFSIVRDMRKIKELQNELIHAGRLAAIGEMASGVAHDIGNPLTVILLANENVLRTLDAPLPDDGEAALGRVRQSADDIRRAAGSIEKLSTHLRDFSRGVAEAHHPMDLFGPMTDALFMAGSKITRASVVVENPTERGLHYVRGCVNQLEQVFVNLISNACDAMRGRPERRLSISMSPCQDANGAFWCCEFRDTGCGIPADKAEDVFRSFFTTKPKGEGTGLGLAICAGIIRDHGGSIELAQPTDGEGACFRVMLPAIDAPDEDVMVG